MGCTLARSHSVRLRCNSSARCSVASMIVTLTTLAESYRRSLARAQVRSLLSSRTAMATVPWRDDSTALMSRDIRAASSGLRVERQAGGTWAVLALAATAGTGASSAETMAVAMAVRR